MSDDPALLRAHYSVAGHAFALSEILQWRFTCEHMRGHSTYDDVRWDQDFHCPSNKPCPSNWRVRSHAHRKTELKVRTDESGLANRRADRLGK